MDKSLSLFEIVDATIKKYPQEQAIYYEQKSISYQKLGKEINRFAECLVSLGVKAHDIVTVCMPNMPQAIYAFYAINKIGAICYEVHPKTTLKQMENYFYKTNSKILLVIDIFSEKYLSLYHQGVKIITFNPFYQNNLFKRIYCYIKSPHNNIIKYEKIKFKNSPILPYKWDKNETAVLLNSGGTTGESKQIELSNEALNNLANNGLDILQIKTGVGAHMFGVLPMFHGFGLCMGIHAPLMFGGSISLMMKFHTKSTIQLIKKNKLTILIGVPAIFKALLRNKKFYHPKLKNIKVSYVGGDFVSPDLINKYNETMLRYGSNSRLYEGYGLTETVTVCCVNTDFNNRPFSVGRPLKGCQIKTIDLESKKFNDPNVYGEIVVSGNFLMSGYYKDQVGTNNVFFYDEDGIKWLKTGDYGMVDSDNYVFFKQRLKRIVKVSGVIICPSEIENIVSTLEEVYESYVCVVNDEIKDHMLVLFIVKNNKLFIDDVQLKQKVNNIIVENLSIYAKPKEIIFLDEFPKTEIGKIDGKVLEERIKK